jgi:SAM-dependent methyltransferase
MSNGNLDPATVQSFGDEWLRHDQSSLSTKEAVRIFESYFALFPWASLSASPVGFDMGCGSGRWAKMVAPRVHTLHCIDPSDAIDVARANLDGVSNVEFHRRSVDSTGLSPASMDFGYSLGVLHHVPDTAAAIRSCVLLLKPGAPLLLYLYYAFDNRPLWFRAVWKLSDLIRRLVVRLPPWAKGMVSDFIALCVYLPLAKTSRVLEGMGFNVSNVPLSAYRNLSWYTMRTDSRDRFGTPLEQRFTRAQIAKMMSDAGLESITVGDSEPYWCAIGFRRFDEPA